MTAIKTRVALDTYVKSTRPTVNYQQASRLGVKGSEQYAYIYFSRPFPLGATIKSARLKVKTYAMTSGTHVLTVNRTGSRTVLSRLNWNNRPQIMIMNEVSVTKTGSLPGATEWDFDVAPIMQQVSDGAQWYGFRIAITEDNQRWIYGEDSDYGPILEVEWSDAPEQPENLVPSGGLAAGTRHPILRFDYIDLSGSTVLDAVQVQIHTSNSWSSPAFDSGEVDATEPELDLSKTSYAGLPWDGSLVWWRVRVKDEADLWSDWSDATQMRCVARPTVTVHSPTGQFYDTTQNVTWSINAGNQSAYQVMVVPAASPSRVLWNSGKVSSTDTGITIPSGVVRYDDTQYRFIVRLWDRTKRATTPGSPAYGQTTVNSLYDKDDAVPGVTDLTVTDLSPQPYVRLSWAYGSLPDAWSIVRNGEIIERLDSDDVSLTNGRFYWTDRKALPRTENRYVVRPVINGRTAYGNTTARVTPKPFGIWLMTEYSSLCLVGMETGTFEMVENSTEHQVLGSSKVVTVNQGIGGYKGEINGQLVSNIPGLSDSHSAQAQRDRLFAFKAQAARGKQFRLVVGDMNIPVQISNVVPTPRPEEEIMFDVSFNFSQDGELPFDLP